MKIKMLKSIDRWNVMGYEHELLTAKEDEVLEISIQRGNQLIKDGLAVETEDEAIEEETEEDSTNPEPGKSGDSGSPQTGAPINTSEESSDEFFVLQPESIAYLRELDKDKIEAILKSYDVDVDKRKALPHIRKELVQTVGSALPDQAATSEDVVAHLIKFYGDNFKVTLSEAFYDEKNLSKLTEDMGTILTQAFEDENS